jgi:hypothetical protein
MEKMRLAGNPVIPRKVDSLLGEELKAREAIGELLDKGFEYYYLQKLLSAGVLGIEKKLVPTRWSITAADRMIADLHIRELKEFSELDEIRVYSSAYLHNRFEILLLPGRWEFEQFESWPKGSAWGSVVEYEPFGGRSDYAEKEGGGYYAGRLACAEFLAAKLKRQARVIVFREIDEEYKVPVGVWQVRENCRNAFENPPEKFNTLKEALEFLGKKLKNPVMDYVKKSSVIGQRKLGEY